MKIVCTPQGEGFLDEVKRQFAEINRLPGKSRRYSDGHKDLVRQAAAQGIKVPELRRLTGVSACGIRSWLGKKGLSGAPKARRLDVVDSGAPTLTSNVAVVVRLPSGVSIELRDGRLLSAELMCMLSGVGGGHAASC